MFRRDRSLDRVYGPRRIRGSAWLLKLSSVRLYLVGEESHEQERVAKTRLASVIQARTAYFSRQEASVVVLVPDFSPQLKKHVHGVFGSALVLLAAISFLAIATR